MRLLSIKLRVIYILGTFRLAKRSNLSEKVRIATPQSGAFVLLSSRNGASPKIYIRKSTKRALDEINFRITG